MWGAVKEAAPQIGRVKTTNDMTMRVEMQTQMGGPIATLTVVPSPGGGTKLGIQIRLSASAVALGARKGFRNDAIFQKIRTKAFDRVATELANFPVPPAPVSVGNSVEPNGSSTGASDLVQALKDLTELHAAGALTAAEFEAGKSKILGH